MRYAIPFIALGLLSACGEEPPPPPPPVKEYRLEVSAKEEGNPVALVPVQLDGKVVGYTDRDGVFTATITERPGKQVTLSVGDIEGYKASSDTEVTEALRLTSAGIGIPIALDVTYESLRREYMVWVSLDCSDKSMPAEFCVNLPVLKDGNEIARTDEYGQAHATFHEIPQREIKITVDTPTVNPLSDPVIPVPEDPTYPITLDFQSQVYLIEDGFVNALQGRRPAASQPRTTRRKLDVKASTPRPKQNAKPKPIADPKKKEEIDLW